MKRLGGCIIGGVILVLLASFADPAVSQFDEFYWSLSNLAFVTACLLPVLAFTLAALFLILRRGDERSITRLAFLALLVSFLARMAWVLTFDSYQVNDFGRYLGCAADVAVSGDPSQSGHCPKIGYVYWRRAAFYVYPLVLAFGPSLKALKIANALLATLTGLFFYLAGRKIYGARIAAAGLLFFIWHPDLWYAMTLASHDVPGMFWLAVFFHVSILLRRSLLDHPGARARHLGFSLLTGTAVFLVGITRSYQYGAFAGLGACAAIHAAALLFSRDAQANEIARSAGPRCAAGIRARATLACAHLIFLLAIPALVNFASMRAFMALWRVSPPGDALGGITCYLSAVNVLGTNQFDEIENWMDECPTIPEKERTGFAARKTLHDMSHDPDAFLFHVVRKNRVLSRADDYLFWAGATEPEPWDTTSRQVGRINSSHLPEQSMAVYIAHLVLLLLVAWRLLLYPSIPFRADEVIPIVFSALYYGMFLLFLESQARYMIFLLFLFSWMAGQAVVDVHDRFGIRSPKPALAVRGRWVLYAGGALLLGAAIGLYWCAAAAIADGPLTLRDQSGFSPSPVPVAGFSAKQQISPVFVANNHKQLILAYPAGSAVEAGSEIAVQKTFVLRPGTRVLRFFLSTDAVRRWPFADKVGWSDQRIEYQVLANGFPVARGDVQDIPGSRYVAAYAGQELDFSRNVTLQLILRNTSRIDRVGPERGPILALEYVDLQ